MTDLRILHTWRQDASLEAQNPTPAQRYVVALKLGVR